MPETLVEAELFGHVKGSFTGATTDRAGCFEMAEGGALFLDEVADLSPGAQAKLLRVLETRAVRRVGGTREFIVNLRVIAATNSPLEDLVQQKNFRQDLYFRLNVFNIEIPPLRQRRQDIIPLAQHFLSLYLAGRKLPIQGFSEPAQQALMDYDYPGNARELKNLIERAAILCRQGQIGPEHLSLPGCPSGADAASDPAGQDPEKDLILAALEEAKWNRQLAALNLGMPYSTLRYKIKKFGIA